MGGRARGLEAAALVDGYVDEGRAGLHGRELRARDELGRRGAGDQHGPDHHVGFHGLFGDVAVVGVERLEIAAEHVVEIAQPRDRPVKHGHVGAHAGGDPGGVGADHAAADHHHPRRRDTGHAAQKHAAPAVGLLERPGADLRREAPGHLGHRRQKRKAAVAVGHGLVGDAGGARGQEVARLVRVGGKVQVGEQDLALAQALALDGLRFLHLHDHLGGGEDLFGRGQDPRAGGDVIGVGEARAQPGPGFDQHLMAVGHRLARGMGRHADPELLRLDLLRTADLHGGILPDLIWWKIAARHVQVFRFLRCLCRKFRDYLR